MACRITFLCFDCADPDALARFWCQVLGWYVSDTDEDGVRIQQAPDSASCIDFLKVPDGAKTTKNRLHLDVNATDRDQAAELQRLLALGATAVDIGQDEVSWHVLADPEGNEFCLLSRRIDPR
jgi:predicted enzyme related to lactoylglutathione lyase